MSFVSKMPSVHRKLERLDPVGRTIKDQVADSPTRGMQSPLTRAVMARRSQAGKTNTTKTGG